jgi:hypothetical protein
MPKCEELLSQVNSLKELALSVQDDNLIQAQREAALASVSELYHDWYRESLACFGSAGDDDGKLKFEAEYEGSFFFPKILTFLTDGLKISPLYNPAAPNPLIPKWTYRVTNSFVEPLTKQSNYLASLASQPSNTQRGSSIGWDATICRILSAFIDMAENAKSNQEKKFSYEYLALFLIGGIEGLRVIGQDVRGSAEEVDLWVANQSSEQFLQKHLGDPFIVECKNWEVPLGAKELRNIRSVMDDKKVRFVLVLAKSGVTGSDTKDALAVIYRAFREDKIIVVLDHADLLRCATGVHPLELIQEKVYELFKKS